MKKTFYLCLFLGAAMLTGCGEKFEPTESTIYVTSKGNVKSAVMESFDKTYYDFEELSEEVSSEVENYCKDAEQETAVVVESLTQEADAVTLIMDYKTVQDYEAFNEMILFAGTYKEAQAAGYTALGLYNVEGEEIELSQEEAEKLNVIVTEESVCVQTKGKIQYVSDNVSIQDKKLAKVMEAGNTHLAFILYK